MGSGKMNTDILEKQFELVTMQIEGIENKMFDVEDDEQFEAYQDLIVDLEMQQYDIQNQIEELEGA